MGVAVQDVVDYECGLIDPRLSFHQRYARAVGVMVAAEAVKAQRAASHELATEAPVKP
jgi:hypothetical protein